MGGFIGFDDGQGNAVASSSSEGQDNQLLQDALQAVDAFNSSVADAILSIEQARDNAIEAIEETTPATTTQTGDASEPTMESDDDVLAFRDGIPAPLTEEDVRNIIFASEGDEASVFQLHFDAAYNAAIFPVISGMTAQVNSVLNIATSVANKVSNAVQEIDKIRNWIYNFERSRGVRTWGADSGSFQTSERTDPSGSGSSFVESE